MDTLTLVGSSLIIFSLSSYIVLSWWIKFYNVENWLSYLNHLNITWIMTSFLFLLPDLVRFSTQTTLGAIPLWITGISLTLFSMAAYYNIIRLHGKVGRKFNTVVFSSAVGFIALRNSNLLTPMQWLFMAFVLILLVLAATVIAYSRHMKYLSFTALYYILSSGVLMSVLLVLWKKWALGFRIFVISGSIAMLMVGFSIFYLEFYYKDSKVKKERERLQEQKGLAAQNRAYFLENYDSTTRLRNQKNLASKYPKWIEEDVSQWLALLNIVNFKQLNNTYGYQVGNEFLKQIADWLVEKLREERHVFRFENDVFLVRVVADASAIKILFENLQEEFVNEFSKAYKHANLSLQIAVTPIKADQTLENHLQELSIAREMACPEILYNLYDGQKKSKYNEKVKLQASLMEAVKNESFSVLYQPKVELRTRKTVGAEALVRLVTEEGVVSPDKFIPLAEETGLINDIGYFVLKTVFEDSKRTGYELPVSINLSAVQLFNEKFICSLETLVRTLNIPTEQFTLEITESAVMKNFEEGIKQLHRLRDLGFRVSLDDFGTGYSSFAYLMHMPIQEIKVDRSLVKNISKVSKQQILMKTLLRLGSDLKMTVIVEGIENEEQREAMIKLGADFGQGYLFSRPVPWATIQEEKAQKFPSA